MASRRLTNGLLVVIASCLILITWRLYASTVVTPAYAQGSSLSLSRTDLMPVAIYGKYAGGQWYPIEIDSDDVLKVKPVR